MANFIQGSQLRTLNLGRYVKGQTADVTTNANKTYTLFDVAGGEVLITALWGKVTTAITVADTINLQTNPTTGDTVVVATATDLGTTDTAAGSTIGVSASALVPATALAKGGQALQNLVVTTGTVESVVTGTAPDGVIEWYCTYVPLTDGATLVASTVAPA